MPLTIELAGILAYVAIQLAIGLWVSRRIRTESDYLLAGRRLGLGMASFSILATWFGAEACIASSGAIYESGLAGGRADPFGYALCIVLMGLVFAVRLWKRNLTTLADLFRERYSPGIERLAAIIMVPTSVLWAAAQIRAFGQVVASASPIGIQVAITIATIVVVLYTTSGGLYSDVVTDLIQGVAILAGLLVIFFAVGNEIGGVASAAALIEPDRLSWVPEGAGRLETLEAWAVPILGSVVAQELIARVLASRGPSVARNASFLAASGYLVFGLIPVGLGLVGPAVLPGLDEPEQLLPRLAQHHLPTVGYILFAGALVSAILSTVDSALLAAASLTSHNLFVSRHPESGERKKILLARSAVVFFGIVAYVLALHSGGIYELVAAASAFGSAGILTLMVFGLFTGIGGVGSAAVALIAGTGVWLAGTFLFGWTCPYLASLAAAFGGYLVTAAVCAGLCGRKRIEESVAKR